MPIVGKSFPLDSFKDNVKDHCFKKLRSLERDICAEEIGSSYSIITCL